MERISSQRFGHDLYYAHKEKPHWGRSERVKKIVIEDDRIKQNEY